MTRTIEFLVPRIVGRRFAEHAIPLEILKDLAALEEMIVEIAKWCYLQDHPARKRAPKGFTDGIALKLMAVGSGSAVAKINLYVDDDQLFPPANQRYFEAAKAHLIAAINAAEHDEPISEHLPDALLSYFDRVGRGLREDEVIEFAPAEPTRKARLTKTTRRKLVLASSQLQELTDEVALRGAIPEADQEKMTFELQVINGPRVSAPIASQHLQAVMDGFNGYKQGARVMLQGVGRYNRYERLQKIESVEHLSLLDPNDIAARVEEIKGLRDGWLDGKGLAPSEAGLNWLVARFEYAYPDDLLLPYLYPTAEGGIQAEWSIGDNEITLEIDIDSQEAEWHALDMVTDVEDAKLLNLNINKDWEWLLEAIKKLTEGAA